jgi:hypothetical protein
MKDLYNKIMYTKFHIKWVFLVLGIGIVSCVVALARLL